MASQKSDAYFSVTLSNFKVIPFKSCEKMIYLFIKIIFGDKTYNRSFRAYLFLRLRGKTGLLGWFLVLKQKSLMITLRDVVIEVSAHNPVLHARPENECVLHYGKHVQLFYLL